LRASCLPQGHVAAQPGTWLTQRTELFQDSLRDNLLLACPGASDERLWQALEDAGLASDVRAMAQGLESRLGEGGLGLSGGRRAAWRWRGCCCTRRRAGCWTRPKDWMPPPPDVLACLQRQMKGTP
jgi:ATP-binding cassette subfamily C protein CydC